MPPWDLEATSPLKSRPAAKHGFLSSSQQAWGLAWAFHPRPWLSLRATVCSAARNPELTTGRGPAPAGQGQTGPHTAASPGDSSNPQSHETPVSVLCVPCPSASAGEGRAVSCCPRLISNSWAHMVLPP